MNPLSTMEPKSSPPAMPELEAAIRSLPSIEDSIERQKFEEYNGSSDCNGNNRQQSIRKGRPLGSRNKRKENPIVYRDNIDTMMPHVINVEAGADIVQCLHRLYQSLQVQGLYVMSAIGTVVDVTISMAGSLKRLSGISQILSLSGSYLPDRNSLSITLLAGGHNVIAGTVQGILRAAGPVDIVAGSCVDPSMFAPCGSSNSVEGDDNSGDAASLG